MATSPNLRLPYPGQNENPFYEAFQAFVSAVDRKLLGSVEDRNLLLSGGGELSWTLQPGGGGLLTWDEPFAVFSPVSGLLETLAAGSISLAEGEFLFVRVARLPLTPTTLVAAKASRVDLDAGQGDPLIIGLRKGGKLYLRTGSVLSDGDVLVDLAPAQDLYGDVEGPPNENTVRRLRGALVAAGYSGSELVVGEVLTVQGGANPTPFAYDGTSLWVARSGTNDVIAYDLGSNTRTLIPLPDIGADEAAPRFGVLQGGYAWVLGLNGGLYKIDASTQKLVATYASGAVDPTCLVGDGTRLWIGQGSSANLRKFVPDTASFGDVPVPVSVAGGTFAVGYVWAGGSTGDVYRIDPATTAYVVVASGAPDPIKTLNYHASTQRLWTVQDDGSSTARRINVNTPVYVAGSFSLGADVPVSAALVGDDLFVTLEGAQVAVLQGLNAAPAVGTATPLPGSGESLGCVYANVWVCAGHHDVDKLHFILFPGAIAFSSDMGGLLGYAPGGGGGGGGGTFTANVVNVDNAASPYSVTSNDYTVAVDSSGGAVTVELPEALPVGCTLVICDVQGSAGTNAITITGVLPSTFDGAASYVINTSYGSVTLQQVASLAWKVI